MIRPALIVSLTAALAGAAGGAACSERERPPRVPVRAEQPPRRVPAPPTVRSLPPHAIRADGVGPYRFSEKVSSMMAQLPSGPRQVRFEIPNVVRTSVIRAEEDTVLIGGETTSTPTFVAVLGAEVARTEAGVHVGSTLDELVRLAGPLVEDPDHARDPRLVVPGTLRNARVLLEGERILAFVVAPVAADRPPPKLGPQPEAECKRPVPPGRRQVGACLTASGELIDLEDDELVIHPADSEKALVPPLRLPGLVFAAPLRTPGDARDELVVVTRSDEPHLRAWSIVAFRIEGGRLVRTVDPQVLYDVSSMQSRWIGAELRDVELFLEVAIRPQELEVSGLLATRAGERVRDVVPLSPKVVARRPHRAPPESGDAGAGSARTASGAGPRE